MSAHRDEATGLSRRKFLGIGAGAAGAIMLGPGARAATAADATGRGVPTRTAATTRSDRFGRIFRLPAFADPSERVTAALLELGKPGGPLDAHDALERGPKDLIVDLSLSEGNPNNPTHTAGTTFIGQFIDHDITFDASSRLGLPTPPEGARNFRTPALDLDSVYGQGPVADQALYDPADTAKLKLESGGLFEDLPRTHDNRAIIADPRNDEHLILAGLHAAFIRFHNNAVDKVRAEGAGAPGDAFAQARRVTTWHYQWLVVHEFLPLIVGQAMVDDVLKRGRRFFTPRDDPFIPVDFQGAAYRFGHSMIRPSYRANLAGDGGQPFFGLIFDPRETGKPDPDDLSGGVRAPRRFVGWQTFFDFGDGEVRPNKLIDTKLSTPLFNLPLGAIASHDAPTSLPQRTLLRHLTWQLPSGQSVAREIGAATLGPSNFRELRGYAEFDRGTPLWYYILKEAELTAGGRHLGPAGGRIVGEVILGLLQADDGSYLNAEHAWRPTLPAHGGTGDFRMIDFLAFAGVDPAGRGQ
jgi:hypothetical protein